MVYQNTTHRRGSDARILLTSVFGPYAQDDDFGSQKINPMELWHNQVTRVQGPFSLRMFNRSFGMLFIQSNIDAPCIMLDFPTLDRFIEEITTNEYDIIGIGSITINVLKVKKMCELVREYQPNATIVVGGHVANLPDLEHRIDADAIVKGEGVRWFRNYLGEDPNRPLRHPEIPTYVDFRNLGTTIQIKPRDRTVTLIPSVGCPLGCNFCLTSAMFGGKGKFVNFYDSGDELFDVICQLEASMGARSFFVMDENFLLHRPRAVRLLELMKQHDKAWSFNIFSSANVVRKYSYEELVELGISWIWMGLEGEQSRYTKLRGIDTRSLVRELQRHGIRILGSTIIGLEEHSPENIDSAIDYAVSHDTDFHQFMLYTALPGTALYAELKQQGLIKDESEVSNSDHHGQYRFNFRHPLIRDGQETEYLLRAFHRDFQVNGPSVIRAVTTTLRGWRRYQGHADPRIRKRFKWESRDLVKYGVPMVAAAAEYFLDQPLLQTRLSNVLDELFDEFGELAEHFAKVVAPSLLEQIRDEQLRLQDGWTYEPPTFYEKNDAWLAIEKQGNARATVTAVEG
ncbi:MAG TPA: cobalamin-dependent protein [Pirellulaceae bacterium]|nr:cobalamin-dependent protein [Pirellulaceae bacterium]